MKKIFEGTAIRVVAANLDAPRTLVTFTHWAQKPPRRMIYPSLAERAGMGFVGFVSFQNHWWQTPEFETTLRAVETHVDAASEITMFGASMGGAGALLASQMLRADKVLAVAPPVIADTEFAPFEERFQSVAALTKQIYPAGPSLSPDTETFTIYDPFFRLDVLQLRLLADAGRTFHRWPIPFSGHAPLLHLKQAGLLRAFNDAFFVRGDKAEAKDIVWSARGALGLVELRNLQRRHFGARRYFAEGYIAALDALLSAYPNQIEMLEERGFSYERQGRYEDAMRDFLACQALDDRKRYQRNIDKLSKRMANA